MSMDTLKSNREYKEEDFDKQLPPIPKLNSKKTFCNLAGMLLLLPVLGFFVRIL